MDKASDWLTVRATDPAANAKRFIETAIIIALIAFGLGYCVWRG